MKLYILFLSCFIVGVLVGYISTGKVYFNKFLNLLDEIRLGIIDRIDRAIIGNDGAYSNTRIINLVWGIGGFCLICLAVVRAIKIPVEVLALMGGAMGITGIQNVINKANELKAVVGQAISPNSKTVADEVKDDKPS